MSHKQRQWLLIHVALRLPEIEYPYLIGVTDWHPNYVRESNSRSLT